MAYIPDLIKEKLVAMATNRLEHHPAILSRLKIELESNSRSTSRMTSAVSNMEFAACSAMGQMHDIDERFLDSIDFWVRGQPEFLRVRAPIAPTQTDTLIHRTAVQLSSDGPAKSQRKKRVTWQTELPYIATIYSSATQIGAKGLWRELKAKAGAKPSPFVVGKGTDRDKLVVIETQATLAEHTLETNMDKVRKTALQRK